MKISVLVTTFARRPYLERCIEGLLAQARLPDEIVLVTRKGDAETEAYVADFLGGYSGPVRFRRAEVTEPGVLPANRAGLALVTGEILCFIDDDAVARRDWIERIERRFEESPEIGAVGGRDVQQTSNGVPDDLVDVVGRIHWHGRVTGQHHLRFPGYHEVHALKGCNMAFRRALIGGFDERIIGDGYFYEVDLCFAVRQAGYRVMYDGDLEVDHYVEAPRMLPGYAKPLDPQRHFYMHRNSVYVLLKNLPIVRKLAFLAYTMLWDGLAAPVRLLSGNPAGRPRAVTAIYRGKISGVAAYLGRGRAGGSGRSRKGAPTSPRTGVKPPELPREDRGPWPS